MKYVLALAALTQLACSSESTETHALEVTAYGEEFIEEGIPADALADGWAITFDAFSVHFTDISVAGQAVPAATLDLTEPTDGSGQVVATLEANAGEIDDAEFTIRTVQIEGSATRGEITKTFSWIFEAPTRYFDCEPGPTVEEGKSVAFQMTIHADHLFYDSLVADEPELRFDALAAADTGDGTITAEELQAADIGGYDVGSDGAISKLWDFLEAQVKSLGHVNGEGHCDAEPALTD